MFGIAGAITSLWYFFRNSSAAEKNWGLDPSSATGDVLLSCVAPVAVALPVVSLAVGFCAQAIMSSRDLSPAPRCCRDLQLPDEASGLTSRGAGDAAALPDEGSAAISPVLNFVCLAFLGSALVSEMR